MLPPLSLEVSYTRSKGVSVDTRDIFVYFADHYSIRWAGSWRSSSNGMQTSCWLAGHARPAFCVLYGSSLTIGAKWKVFSDFNCSASNKT